MRSPNNTQRLSIIGKTGEGKSHAGAFFLSLRDFKIPFVIINSKNDFDIFGNFKYTKILSLDENIDQYSSLFMIIPQVGEEKYLDDFLNRIWQNGDCGLFIDEAADLKGIRSYEKILRQGRSKCIPVIQITQRPTDVTRSFYSESEFFDIFKVIDTRDQETISKFCPLVYSHNPKKRNESDWGKLKKRESFYYDVAEDNLTILQPLPDLESISETINRKTKPKLKIF
jgi:hypothetical protein